MNKLATLAITTAAVTGVAVAGLVAGPSASATSPDTAARSAGSWHTHHVAGDIAGANTSGHTRRLGNNRVSLTGVLTDTNHHDGKRAVLQIGANYKKGKRSETVTALRSTAFDFNFAPSVKHIYVRECLGHKLPSGALNIDRCAVNWLTVW